MKPLHECAVIKDGNKRTAYLVANSDVDKALSLGTPWKLVGAHDFEELVKNNKVQYLIWDNNTIKCRYEAEEIRSLRKISHYTKEYIVRTQEDYWNMDVIFKYRHIEAAQNNLGLACCLAGVTKMFGLYMVPVILYGNTQAMSNMVYELSVYLGKPLDKCLKHNGETIGQLILPEIYFDKLIRGIGRKYKIMFDTSTIKFMLRNNIRVPRIPIIQGKADPEKTLSLINKVDRITLDNEKELGI